MLSAETRVPVFGVRFGRAGGRSPYNPAVNRRHGRQKGRQREPRLRSAAARLVAAEALFRDFVRLTPYEYRPFVKTFDSFEHYERWRRAQTNPWYR
jgi:hypothetical protein